MKKLVIANLAHVDAGKTTLSEAMLFTTGNIRKLGRVDHKDAYLDTFELERARGITIFSKQALLKYDDIQIMLLDTPGHVDFSAEMERTLQVLDYAILVISGTDGVQGHTETLWKLLKRYNIPTFLFINKMDLADRDKRQIMLELKARLSANCVDFTMKKSSEEFRETISLYDEQMMERYLEGEVFEEIELTQFITKLVTCREIFPCFFGSALKLDGVDELLTGIRTYTQEPDYPAEFGGKVFKIARDDQGKRLTYLKVTGGRLKVKDAISYDGEEEEKIDQIRMYSGTRFDTVSEVMAGEVCAVTGLTKTHPGLGLGMEKESEQPVLEPVLTYKIILPQGCDAHTMLVNLRELEEEEPELHIVWNETLKEIRAQVMGEIQIEILKSLIQERFGVEVEFGAGSIVYKETLKAPVIGVGHFEPLRHYAEVHLLMEPGEEGSGITYDSMCNVDNLAGNWQRLIFTHIEEREHLGVLTGAPLTDVKITIIAGRAHEKHTEGGDFRQATYRAIRQGLKKAESVLLEPYYKFKVEVPTENIGRVMTDIQKMNGEFNSPDSDGELSIITGKAPVSTMHDYSKELISHTKGKGRIFCELVGYRPCHNAEEVIEHIGYDSESDLDNPTGSVFCAHGAGFNVKWDEVDDFKHLAPQIKLPGTTEPQSRDTLQVMETTEGRKSAKKKSSQAYALDKELEQIFEKTFGPVKRRLDTESQVFGYEKGSKAERPEKPYVAKWDGKEPVKDYLLVDGYNLLFYWDELNELSKVNLEAARTKLMDILCNYQGYKKCIVILVYDAYKVKGNPGSAVDYHNIHVVYTKEAQTADSYIEKATHELVKKARVSVVTSDGIEQLIIMGQGARRISSREFKEEIETMEREIREQWLN